VCYFYFVLFIPKKSRLIEGTKRKTNRELRDRKWRWREKRQGIRDRGKRAGERRRRMKG